MLNVVNIDLIVRKIDFFHTQNTDLRPYETDFAHLELIYYIHKKRAARRSLPRQPQSSNYHTR